MKIINNISTPVLLWCNISRRMRRNHTTMGNRKKYDTQTGDKVKSRETVKIVSNFRRIKRKAKGGSPC